MRLNKKITIVSLFLLSMISGCSNLPAEKGKSAFEIYKEYYPDYSWGEKQWIDDLASGSLLANISFETFGGTAIEDLSFHKGEKIALPENPEKEKGEFLGWYLEDTYQTLIDENFAIDSSRTLFAKYEMEQHIISWNIDGNIVEHSYDYGSAPIYDGETPKKADDGCLEYSFVGWYPELSTVTEDKTYTAQFSSSLKAFPINFIHDDNVRIKVYTMPDMSDGGAYCDSCYSLNNKGKYDRSGGGQINFTIEYDDGFYLKDLDVYGNYKNIKCPEDLNATNTYRITKINGSLTVMIKSSEAADAKMIKDVKSFTNSDGTVNFGFDYMYGYNVSKVIAKVYKNNIFIAEEIILDSSFSYLLEPLSSYKFLFIPCVGELEGLNFDVHRSFADSVKDIGFTRTEIETKDSVWPTCDLITQMPSGVVGHGIKNAEYANMSIKVYNKTGSLSFNSEDYLDKPEDRFSGSKIKIRGNSSAWVTKKPYKIKLSTEANMFTTPNMTPEKEWVLLSSGDNLQYLLGRGISNLIEKNYSMDYEYTTLFINGDYCGLYILARGVNNHNCKIDEQGYIVELDLHYWKENVWFNTTLTESNKNYGYSFKSPDPETFNEESEKCMYIKDTISSFEDLLIAGDKSALDYIDINSYVNWVMIHDILLTFDSGGSNPYILKNSVDSKFVMGPTWDFDSILGANDSNISRFSKIRDSKVFHYYYLFDYEEFEFAYKVKYSIIQNQILKVVNNLINDVPNEYSSLLTIENSCYCVSRRSVEQIKTDVNSFLTSHIDWMSQNIG